ncbi:hypothetical protein OTU49_016461 [Cherax quadricarinatus]|uniref:Uncharacterized protein n=2 Tax=Cherax quadricarinatus TaxID=27406 RepID=A0AAW0YS62_CHEQU
MSRILRSLLQNLYNNPSLVKGRLYSRFYRKEYNAVKNLSLIKRLESITFSTRQYSNSSSFEPSKLIINKVDDDEIKSHGEDAVASVVERTDDSELAEDELEHLLPSQRQKHHSDLLLTKISESQTTHDVLYTYKRHRDVMNVRHYLETLKQLSNLVCKGIESGAILSETEDFRDLCHEIYRSTRRMELDELMSTLKYLCRLEVPSESKLIQSVLQMLKYYINDLELRQLIFLEFLLKKMPLTTLSDALRTALPILIENCLKPETLVNLSLMDLSQILSICVHGKVRNTGMVLKEIYKRGRIDKPSLAMTFIWNLSDIHIKWEKMILLTKEDILTREVLIKECIETLSRDISSLTQQQVETTLSKLCEAYEKRDICCYNEHFLQAVSDFIVHEKLGFVKVAHFIRKFLKMNYHCEKLTHYMMNLVLECPQDVPDARVGVIPLISFLSACDQHPSNVNDVLDILMDHKSVKLDPEDFYRKPLLVISQELLSLGYYHHTLVKIITNPDSLRLYMSRYDNDNTNHKRLLEVDVALDKLFNSTERVPDMFLENGRSLLRKQLPSKSGLKSILHQILGEPQPLISGVLTDSYIYIDHVLVLDEKGYPVQLTPPETESQTNVSASSLEIPDNCTRVAILDIGSSYVYKPGDILVGPARLKQKLLELEGFTVVCLLQSVIYRYQPDEKALYVKRELANAGIAFK